MLYVADAVLECVEPVAFVASLPDVEDDEEDVDVVDDDNVPISLPVVTKRCINSRQRISR